MRFYLPDDFGVRFYWVSELCKLLCNSKKQLVEIELRDWNDNSGIEYDILQSVVPAKIPLAGTPGLPVGLVTSFEAELYEIIHFVYVAFSVDAYFSLRWIEQESQLHKFDAAIEVQCGDEIKKDIELLALRFP